MSKEIVPQNEQEVKCALDRCREPVYRDGLCWEHSVEKKIAEWDAQDAAALEFDRITLVVQYEGTSRYLRSAGVIVEVRRNGGPGREPKDPDLGAAIRWLAENGYEPVPEEFEWLDGDRPGVTTFRPRRRQVYRREVRR